MATKTATNPKWIRSDRGDEVTIGIAYVLHHTSTHYHVGEFLRCNSSGLIVQCTTGAAAGVGADAVTHWALREQAAIGNSTTTKSVGVVHEDDMWEINEHDTTVGRAAIGQHYAMNVSSNLCTMDTTDTTNVVFEVINPVWAEQPFQNSSADTLALAIVKVLGTAIHAAPAS